MRQTQVPCGEFAICRYHGLARIVDFALQGTPGGKQQVVVSRAMYRIEKTGHVNPVGTAMFNGGWLA